MTVLGACLHEHHHVMAETAASPHPLTRPQRALLAPIRWYQRAVDGRPSPCRFTPGCSSYAVEAITVHGARRGSWLAVRRLVRCRPFGPSGFDPVPPAEPSLSDSPSVERNR